MAEYRPSRDDIVLGDGTVLEPSQAKRQLNSIEAALSVREAYQNCEIDEEMATNERAVQVLCTDDELSEVPLLVSFIIDTKNVELDDLPDEHVEAWVEQWDNKGMGDCLVKERNIPAFFEESDMEFGGFHVEFDADAIGEHLD